VLVPRRGAGNAAVSVFPSSRAFAKAGFAAACPRALVGDGLKWSCVFALPASAASYHDTAIFVSVESIVTTLSRFPHGIVGMVPTQLPANRLCFEVRCCLTEFVADSLASGFGFGLDDGFSFGFADCSGGGVGVDSSEIGAGSRCGAINSKAARCRYVLQHCIRKRRSARHPRNEA
jgi:hypothetical protein